MDTIQIEARLPQDKLTCISKQLSTWQGRYFVWLDPYSTPVRLYNHTGHTFIAQMYNTAAKVKELQHLTHLNKDFCWDLHWWHTSASYDWLTFKPPLLSTFRQMHQAHGNVELFLSQPNGSSSLVHRMVNRMANRKHHGKGVGPNCCKLCHLGPYLGTETN